MAGVEDRCLAATVISQKKEMAILLQVNSLVGEVMKIYKSNTANGVWGV
jgi:hypothetical protein